MSLISWLPLAAATLFSEKVPSLSEPRMIQIPAGTTVWSKTNGDSAVVGSMGLAQTYRRNGSQVSLMGDRRSDTFNLQYPNHIASMFRIGDSMFNSNLYYQSAFRQELFSRSNTPPLRMGRGLPYYSNGLACGDGEAFTWNNNDVKPKESMRLWDDRPIICNSVLRYAISQTGAMISHARAVMAWEINASAWKWAICSDSLDRPWASWKVDTLRTANVNWVVVDSTGRWLAFDQTRALLFWRTGNPNGAFQYDSLRIPGITTNPRQSYQVSRFRDFYLTAVDSTLLFIRWDAQGARIASRFTIPGKQILATSVASDTVWTSGAKPLERITRMPYVWAITGQELYSFVLNLEEPPISSMASPSRSALFALQQNPHGAAFTWYGSGTEIVRMTGVDGRTHGKVELRPGSTANWTAPHPGLFLAHTPDGVKRILAR